MIEYLKNKKNRLKVVLSNLTSLSELYFKKFLCYIQPILLWLIFNIIAGLVPVLIVYLKEADPSSSNFISNVVTFTLTFYPSVAFGSIMFSKNNNHSAKIAMIALVYTLTVIFYVFFMNNIFHDNISIYISKHYIALYATLGLLALSLGFSLSWDEIRNRADDCIRVVKQEWDNKNRGKYSKAMKG